jgi:hypothetical protein
MNRPRSSVAPIPRPFIVALAVVLGLLAVDAAVWRIATFRLRRAYLGWQSSLAAQGWQVTSAPPIAGGWPIAASLRLNDLRLGQTSSGGFAWTAYRVRFGISLLHPTVGAVDPSGPQTLTLPGLPPIAFAAKRMRATFPLSLPVQSAQATADRLTVVTPSGDVAIAAARMQVQWQPAATHLVLSAGPAALPPQRRWGLGQSITAASIDLTAHGAWPRGKPAEAAGRWRDAAGGIDIAQLGLHWGALDASGSGRAGIGADGQPTARLDLRVVEPQAALSALADAGAITRNAATAAGAVLALLEMPQRLANQPAVLSLPLQIDGGTISLGQIPVARLPRIAW